jgi:hypothetical protein
VKCSSSASTAKERRLQQSDVPVTIYTDKTPEQFAAGRLPNTVGHHHHTLERERALGVHHWDAEEFGYDRRRGGRAGERGSRSGRDRRGAWLRRDVRAACRDDDADRFRRVVLDKLEHHYPMCFERIDHAGFSSWAPGTCSRAA